nr:hypothetical protein CFP56_78103 [Quercus suber]POE90773.1 hypothetical protein CFP56_50511 [Quercus suber]
MDLKCSLGLGRCASHSSFKVRDMGSPLSCFDSDKSLVLLGSTSMDCHGWFWQHLHRSVGQQYMDKLGSTVVDQLGNTTSFSNVLESFVVFCKDFDRIRTSSMIFGTENGLEAHFESSLC